MKTQRIGFLTLLMLTLASTAIYLLNQNRVTASVEDTSIAISGFAFSPETVNVTVGEAVTWTNEDSATHTVTGADFDSSELANGENFSVTFTQVGSYSYVCSIHSSMTGLINVGLAFNNSVYLPTILGPAGSDGQTPVSAPPTGQDALTVNSGNWANPATWQNGRTPQAGDTIIIQDGHTILLDQDSPQLGGLMIVGTLIFDQKDLALTSNWIMVHGPNALLEIGTETVPYEHKATITLTATDPDENISGEGAQASGTNFLMAMEGGTIDIHGSSRDKVNWTQLAETANPGDTQLVLADAVNWEVGDEIAIAPSGYDPYAGERVTITAVDGTTVSITPPLNNPHVAIIETHGGKTLDMRAEVGLLTRNIVIQAPEDALDNQFGGHIMIMETAMARVEGVELVRMGQMRKKGRYPFHWHLAGDVSGHYLKNSSIHTSQHRAVAVHGSHGALVEGVVAYDIWSHAMIPAEDGNEYNNTFKDNLVIQVKNLWDTPEGGDNFAFGTGNNSRTGTSFILFRGL
ncbi:MAG: G8 domain-containing protein, partial [Chloroflexota bacterium]